MPLTPSSPLILRPDLEDNLNDLEFALNDPGKMTVMQQTPSLMSIGR